MGQAVPIRLGRTRPVRFGGLRSALTLRRVGQKNKLTYGWAKRGSRPQATLNAVVANRGRPVIVARAAGAGATSRVKRVPNVSANNGLVGGSSPPGPTTHSHSNQVFRRFVN